MAGRYGRLNRKGSKRSSGGVTVGVINGKPSLQVNSGGKIYGVQLSQIGAASARESLDISSMRVAGTITFDKNSKLINNSNSIIMAGGLRASGDGNMRIGADTNLENLKGHANNTNNLAIGENTLNKTVNCALNIAIGKEAMENIGRSSSDTYLGSYSNVAIGFRALRGFNAGSRQQAFSCVAIGYGAMVDAHYVDTASNTTYRDVCIGSQAGQYLSGSDNVYIGSFSGQGSTSSTAGAIRNVGVGSYSLQDITTGYFNVGVGDQALKNVTTGIHNVGVGLLAGDTLQSGNYNVAVGTNSDIANGTYYNVAIGTNANTTADYGIAIGYVATAPSNTIVIGDGKFRINIEVACTVAHNVDNSVLSQFTRTSSIKIPAYSIITSISAIVIGASNLGTHKANIQYSTTSGTAPDADIVGSPVEILGAGVANTDSSDSASAEDIDLTETKEVWICRDTVRVGASDVYLYVCNAGTGNGTSTSGTSVSLLINVEYYGRD